MGLLKSGCEKPQIEENIPGVDYALLLLLGLVFLGVQNLWFPQYPPYEQFLEGLNAGIRYFLHLQSPPFNLAELTQDYPPLAWWVSCGLYKLFGFSLPLAHLSSLLFVFALIWGVYSIGFAFGGRFIGWLAVFLALGNPRFIYWSRVFNENFTEAALISLVFAVIFLSRDFTRKKSAILLGPLLGLTLLTGYAGYYLLLPLAWLLVRLWLREAKSPARFYPLFFIIGLGALGLGAWRLYQSGLYRIFGSDYLFFQSLGLLAGAVVVWWLSRQEGDYSPLKGYLAALLSALLIALPWYLTNLRPVLGHWLHSNWGWSFTDLSRIYLAIAGKILPGFLWLLLIGLIFLLGNLKKLNCQLLFLGIVPLAWLLRIEEANLQTFLPWLPLLVIVATAWLRLLPGRWRLIPLALALLRLACNLCGVTAVEGNYFSPASAAGKTVARWLEISDYYSPYLLAHTFRDGIGWGKPNFNDPPPDPAFLALPQNLVKDLARQIISHPPAKVKETLILGIRNLQPGLVFYRWQLESYLTAGGYRPSPAGNYPVALELIFFNETGKATEALKPDYLLEIVPAGTKSALSPLPFSSTALSRYRVQNSRTGTDFSLRLYKNR